MRNFEHKILSESPKIELYNSDCMEMLKSFATNQFDLAICDPPYGINIEKNQQTYNKNKTVSNGGKWKEYKIKEWDNVIPTKEYFDELKRVSKNQIIWGGNYFLDHLGKTKCMLIWDKIQRVYLADGEIAWTSLDKPMKVFRYSKIDAYVNDLRGDEKIHPTQNPIKLYEWMIENYTKEGESILDTHLGSGSSAIASFKMNRNFTGIEIDKEYYDESVERFKKQTVQNLLKF